MRLVASVVLLGLASAASAQTVTFTINASQTAPISPYIYGVNGTLGSSGYNNLTLTRAGGNRWTAYNWTNNYSNAGSDWYFENDNLLSSSTAPAAGVAGTIQNGMSNHAAMLLTIPMAGYVSKDNLGQNWDVRMTAPGSNVLDPNWLSDRMMPSQAAKPGGPATFSTNPTTLHAQTTVYQDEYVNYLKTLYPAAFAANSATPVFFDLDNEVDLWTSTHAEVRPIVAGSVTPSNPLGTPTPLTYTELLNDTVTYATAIKAVAPNTLIFGPVSYGWEGYVSLQGAPDSGTYGDFLTYYLNQTAAASKSAGKRLVDVMDLHWYPEATGAGIRITTNDAGYSGSTLAQLQTARIQAARSLFDPTYVENSWITSSLGNQAINLLPREQAKMTAAANAYGAAYAPNKISISEYNYGGGDDISGAIAEADVLGTFGSQGVFSAAFWPEAGNVQYITGGMAMFRNYDGKGSAFGDISVSTTASNLSNASEASIYASEYSTNSARMTLVAINKTTGNLAMQLPLPKAPDGQAFTQAAIYELTAASSTPQFVEDIVVADPANFTLTMPGYSVTTIALTAGSASIWSAPVSGNWSSTGSWTGGVPNAVGAIAVIGAPTTAAATITLDKPQTVGWLQFGNSASAAVGYTVSGTGTNTLTLNNGGNGATITVIDGAHAINAPIVLADNLQVTGTSSGWTLSFGTASSIAGGYGLALDGNGTVVLSGQNTYTGTTTLAAGIVNLGSPEHAGTSGPLGKSAAANPGSIVFNGGTLQYSASNTNDYSGRFSTAANQFYRADTNGQNVTWATALAGSGGSLAKTGDGMLTLAAANRFDAVNVSGGGIAVSSGTMGVCSFNPGAGGSTIAAGAAIATINVSGGGLTVSGGTIGVCNFNAGAGVSTIGASASVTTTNVSAGTVNFNSTRANGALVLPGDSTGMVIVGPASGGRLPKVATADFSATPATGTVNAANPLAISGTLKLPGGMTAKISNGNTFTATGVNLASTSAPSTLGLGGGTLTFPTGSAQSIGVHWSDYAGNNPSPINGTDGFVPQGHWTNVSANWYSGGASNLVSSSGSATTVSVTSHVATSNGTYWWASGPQTGVDNLLVGPGGGNGAIPNAITGIPYASYEIIAYLNNYNNAGGAYSVWLDGNPASSNPSNAPAADSRYYYGATYTSTGGFVLMKPSDATTYNDANTAVWTGLSGPSQTLWTEGWSSTGPNDSNSNEGITGFQILETDVPAYLDLPATSISTTRSSTLDFGETGTPSHYHTLGNLNLTAGTGGGTQLQLQNGLNINFNGISALYPTGGTGGATASVSGGRTSPVISLTGGSSIYVDRNVTLDIGSTIGDPQTGDTDLVKDGGGTLVLSGTNDYHGGTTVLSGTLVLANNGAIRDGTKLAVGNASSFSATMPATGGANMASSASPAGLPVPEPGASILLAVSAALLAAYRLIRA